MVDRDRHPVTGRFLAHDCEIDCQEHCAGLCGSSLDPDHEPVIYKVVAASDPRFRAPGWGWGCTCGAASWGYDTETEARDSQVRHLRESEDSDG
jgi:hypothetical protein